MKLIVIITLLFTAVMLHTHYKRNQAVVKEQQNITVIKAQQNIVVFGTNDCPACQRTKELLESKKIKYTFRNLSTDSTARKDLVKLKSGASTIPQVFINNKYVGGSKEVRTLIENGTVK